MSKTNEELSKLKEEVEAINEKLQELTEEEIAQVSGGGFIPGLKPGQGSSETMGGASLAAGTGLAMYLEKIGEVR